ncbi:MAG: type VI secretion system-associated FHA domain protein TagH [Betaproteobacteria bacterium]|nr:type VI secretion system-associated FHA domain protein TagH [Betaproteobacteria bacterium]
MSYVIEVSSGQGAGAIAMGTRTIVADRATIGRGAECSVALEDPHKYVSRLHAVLDTENGECVLSVVSKINPVMVNATRVGPGVKAKVKTGDQLVIGEFRLIMRDVRPSAAPARAAPSYAVEEKPKPREADVPSDSKAEADELLKELRRRVKPAVEEQAARVPAEPSPRTPAAAPPPRPAPAPLPEDDEDLAEPTFVGKLEDFQHLIKPPAPAPRPSPAPPPEDDADLAEPTFVGKLADFQQLEPSAPAPRPSPAPPSEDDADLAEPTFVGKLADFQQLEPSAPAPAPPPPSPPPPAESDDAIFNEPTFVGERPKELVGVSLLKQYSDDSEDAKEPTETEKPEEAEKSDIDFEIFDEPTFSGERPAEFSAPAPDSPAPSAAAPTDNEIFNEPTFTGPRPAEFAALAASAPDVAPDSVPAPADVSAAVPPEVHALVEAFLEGARIHSIKVRDEDATAFMRDSGAIVRAAIDGLVELLLARSEMKKEMRTEDRTMVASRNNNPLKLVTNPEEAITYLFDSGERTGGFLQPVQAVHDACDDLRAHEIALMAGMRAALIGSIKRLEPQLLEAEYDKKGGMSLNRKAKLWDLFVEVHAKLTSEAEDDFLKVFGREFLGTYEEQVKRLKSAR